MISKLNKPEFTSYKCHTFKNIKFSPKPLAKGKAKSKAISERKGINKLIALMAYLLGKPF
jgi:hypothetical protein